jgi:hypothetical protein
MLVNENRATARLMAKKTSVKPDWMKKHSHKGIACRRGQPICHDELKQNINLTLTPTALNRLKELAIQMNLSRSEVVERWLRNEI